MQLSVLEVPGIGPRAAAANRVENAPDPEAACATGQLVVFWSEFWYSPRLHVHDDWPPLPGTG